ncbi:MAG: helix-turn-helix domain-containing protein [Granulosicoccus sp.]
MINPSESIGTPGAVSDPARTSLDSLPTEEFLRIVGLRVRSQRSTMSMSRKRLAEVSGVSERYLAQLESGQGNMSIALLRKVTTAIGMSLATLLSNETPELASKVDRTSNAHSNGGSQPVMEVGSARTVYG